MALENGKTSKTSAKHWEGRLFKRSYKGSDGEKIFLPDWHVTLCHQGKDRPVCLKTPEKALAAKRAKEAYMLLKTQGWDAMWAVYKVRKSKNIGKVAKKDEDNTPLTIGDYLGRIDELYTFTAPKTRTKYFSAFYKMISDIFDIQAGKEKYDYVNGGNKKRIEKIHAIPLSEITQGVIERWKNQTFKCRMDASSGEDASASTTINSILRSAKSLFSKKILRSIGLGKKIISPFLDVSFLPEESHRYTTLFDAKELIMKAKKELEPKSKNAHMTILLAIGVGLRRNEIDKLLWEQINFERMTISIYRTPGSNESSSEVALEPFIASELLLLKKSTNGGFVLLSKTQARPNVSYTHYRCKKDFSILLKWLSGNNVDKHGPPPCPSGIGGCSADCALRRFFPNRPRQCAQSRVSP
jgi:hypothetical protein